MPTVCVKTPLYSNSLVSIQFEKVMFHKDDRLQQTSLTTTKFKTCIKYKKLRWLLRHKLTDLWPISHLLMCSLRICPPYSKVGSLAKLKAQLEPAGDIWTAQKHEITVCECLEHVSDSTHAFSLTNQVWPHDWERICFQRPCRMQNTSKKESIDLSKLIVFCQGRAEKLIKIWQWETGELHRMVGTLFLRTLL